MNKRYIIGIDLGGTNLKIALLSSKYRIIHKRILSTKGFRNKESLISAIAFSLREIIKEKNITKSCILGVGLGVPGPTDARKGLVHFFPNIPGWKNVPLKNLLKRKLSLPVFVDNDAKLMALAEYRLGVAKKFKNCLCITLGTGVGGGIILGGKLYRGPDNAAGEIGHMPINEEGPVCVCGGEACLERYIGNSSLLRSARLVFKKGISLEDLSEMAKKNNKDALRVWLDAARHLSVALRSAVNLLNLDCIVIGGGVSGAGSVLFKEVKKRLKGSAMKVQAKRVKIFKAKLGPDAGIIGAAILVQEEVT